jgi:organic anion transporter 5A
VGGRWVGWGGGLMDGCVGGWLGGWMDVWMGGWMTGWMGEWVDGWVVGLMDGWMVGCMDSWVGGWVDGCSFELCNEPMHPPPSTHTLTHTQPRNYKDKWLYCLVVILVQCTHGLYVTLFLCMKCCQRMNQGASLPVGDVRHYVTYLHSCCVL